MAAFPELGRERDDLKPGLRSYTVHPFLVFHRVDHDAKTVVVVRILHGAIDIDTTEFDDDV